MMPLARARSAQAGGTCASQNPRRGGSVMSRNYRRPDEFDGAAPRSVDVLGEPDHEAVLDVVEGLHPVGDGDLPRAALGDRMVLGADECGDPMAQLGWDHLLVSEVEHLELVEHVVDVANLVAARVAGVAFRPPLVPDAFQPMV